MQWYMNQYLWIGIAVVVVLAIIVWYYFASAAPLDEEATCEEIDAAILKESAKANGGNTNVIAELRARYQQKCLADAVRQQSIKTGPGEIALPYTVETYCSSLTTSYIQSMNSLKTIKYHPVKGKGIGDNMRLILGKIRDCYTNALENVTIDSINGLIESTKDTLEAIRASERCFRAGGPCQGYHLNIHGDNFANIEILPTIDTLSRVYVALQKRKIDLLKAAANV